MITDNFRALILCGALAIAVAPSAVAQDPAHLKGKVQKEETPVRIRRPGLPVVGAAEPTDAGGGQQAAAKHLRGLAEDDFMLGFKKDSPVLQQQSGKVAPADRTLEAEDDATVIAWEEWHHRVATDIFHRWDALWHSSGQCPGIASTTLTFTRAGRVFCTVHSVEIPDDAFEMMEPQYRMYSIEELKRRFTKAVQDAVMPLEGSSTVQFPERSKRDIVTLTPAFRGGVSSAGYYWKHDDYERVK